MKWMENMAEFANKLISWPTGGMDLATTLFCGQSFSWQENGDGSYTGVAENRAAKVWEQDGTLFLEPLGKAHPDDETFWRHYFALEEGYEKWVTCFKKDAVLRQCVESNPGIRVLNQPFFDVLLSFIISQNNNIPRIVGIANRLREGFGPVLAPGLWGFPEAKVLAGFELEDLAELRAGFRAKYLLDAARQVADGRLREEELHSLATPQAREKLKQVYGVGDKVADCVLLFGLGRKEVAPMDVWMRRALEQHFGGVMPPCTAGAEGVAQQYIFHWVRQQGKEETK